MDPRGRFGVILDGAGMADIGEIEDTQNRAMVCDWLVSKRAAAVNREFGKW